MLFGSVEEATEFWKSLWESEGPGYTSAKWLEEIRSAINERVPEPTDESLELSTEQASSVITKKRNWSAPGPDQIVTFWWNKVYCVHEGVAKSFQAIARTDREVPFWFTEGKIQKAGEFSSGNQRPITCLNTIYKWFTSCLLKPVDKHLNENGLMQGEQRGPKANCSGTIDNLLIDRKFCQDSQRGRCNLSMAWIDVKKAYDSVDHRWLEQMFYLHRFPRWIDDVITRLSAKWNSKIAARIVKRMETSERIRFSKGLPQGDALCPRLFTISINPLAWKLRASEDYRLSRPIIAKRFRISCISTI